MYNERTHKWNQVNDNHNNNNNENGFLFVICFPLIYFYGIAFLLPLRL